MNKLNNCGIIICVLTIVGLLCIPNQETKEVEIENPVYNMMECSVKIASSKGNGSGTVVYSKYNNTFILTNSHIVDEDILNLGEENESRTLIDVYITLYNDKGLIIEEIERFAEIVAFDTKKDLALLWIDDYQTTSVAEFLDINEGYDVLEKVYTTGYPSGLWRVMITTGEISNLNMAMNKSSSVLYGSETDIFRHNSSTYFGSSGGSIYIKREDHYKMIGIPFFLHSTSQEKNLTWIGYAISLSTIREFFTENNLTFIETGDMFPEFKMYPLPETDAMLPVIKSIMDLFHRINKVEQGE